MGWRNTNDKEDLLRLVSNVKKEATRQWKDIAILTNAKQLYPLSQHALYYEAEIYLAGLNNEIPSGWSKYMETEEEDGDYQEYLRLKAKFENK